MDIKTIKEMQEHYKNQQDGLKAQFQQMAGALQALDLVEKTMLEEANKKEAKSKTTKSKK